MILAVEFPSIAYREGPTGVTRLARAIEDIGYDQIDIFDHVAMGWPAPGRDLRYPAEMPILEALTTLGYIAAVTTRVGLGTEVLVLPQRQPVLVAKQLSTLDTLSAGRMRLGVGIGWQPSEFEALGENFASRAKRTEEAIALLRQCWSKDRIDFDGEYYRATAMSMAPKPPQGGALPIWIGGNTLPAFNRVGRLGDGWMGSQVTNAEFARRAMDTIREAAVAAGRDPSKIRMQSMVAPPPRAGDANARSFYAEPDRVLARVVELQAMGFEGVALNATAVFQSGARSLDAMIDVLAMLHRRVRAEVG